MRTTTTRRKSIELMDNLAVLTKFLNMAFLLQNKMMYLLVLLSKMAVSKQALKWSHGMEN
jgi:hypothetical protein